MDNPVMNKEVNLFCNICARNFPNPASLRSHNKWWKHETEPTVHRCNACDKTFSRKFRLVKHMKNCGKSDFKFNCKCSFCGVAASTRLTLFNHYKDDHKIDLTEKQLKFKTLGEFQQWKCKFECDTKSQFCKKTGTYENKKGHQIMKYLCHRDGHFKPTGKNIRHIKVRGSNKINSYCPARMYVYINDEDVTVKYIDTHIGHKLELERLSITKTERDNIAQKLALKIPFSTILDEIRDSSLINNELNRIHLLTRKDLWNIVASYNLNHKEILYKNDYNSVDAWVLHMQSTSNTIRFYKSQNTLSEEYPEADIKDFFLIIMNNAQLEILKKFGQDCICVDGTHGLNSYKFQLYSIMVLDDMKQGFPCGFMFSNRGDTLAMKIFFETVKSCLNGITIVPNTFMSDMENSFYRAWSTVMGPAKHQLYCSWHVDRAWRRNLNKIKEPETQALIYKKLKILQQETDVEAFEMMMQTFVLELSTNPNTVEFANYFIPYKNKCSTWAYCYRKLCGVNTNMNLEAMHKVIKHIYCDGKKVKRLDIAIHILMKFIRDKLDDRIVASSKGKLTHKLQDIGIKHKQAQKLLSSNNTMTEEENNSWNISSSNKKNIYKVSQNADAHNICELYCSDCNSCIHKFSCTCIDFSIKWNMCKHIHLVCIVLRQVYSSEDSDSEKIEFSHIKEDASTSQQLFANDNEENASISELSPTISDESFRQKKEELLAEHSAIFSMIENDDQLQAYSKHLQHMKHVMNSLSN